MVNELYHWDLRRVERLNGELLVWVMVQEGSCDHPIIIPDSPPPIPILAPGGQLLVEINDGVDNKVVQVIMEDQGERRGVWDCQELYEEGEEIMDVLRQVEVQDTKILRYPQPPNYDNPNYIPDVQQ